jgi:hypothetical protein
MARQPMLLLLIPISSSRVIFGFGVLLTFLSHFAFAFAQCTQAIGIRSGDSMPELATVEEGGSTLGRVQTGLEGRCRGFGADSARGRKGGRAEAAFRVSKPQGDEVVLGIQWYFSSECESKRMGCLYAETKEHRRQCQDRDESGRKRAQQVGSASPSAVSSLD